MAVENCSQKLCQWRMSPSKMGVSSFGNLTVHEGLEVTEEATSTGEAARTESIVHLLERMIDPLITK